MQTTTTVVFFAIVAALVLVAILVWVGVRRHRTHVLQERFGDEYDRTLEERGKRGEAESALEERAARVAKLDIRPLRAEEREAAITEWREVKAVFVDSPVEAVHHADRLLGTIMKARGYPMADFDRRYEDLTVDHGEVARHYRDGHEIALRHERGQASTEELRQAMIHFEALFDDLVNEVAHDDEAKPVKSRARTDH
jgi:hypothetical protein